MVIIPADAGVDRDVFAYSPLVLRESTVMAKKAIAVAGAAINGYLIWRREIRRACSGAVVPQRESVFVVQLLVIKSFLFREETEGQEMT